MTRIIELLIALVLVAEPAAHIDLSRQATAAVYVVSVPDSITALLDAATLATASQTRRFGRDVVYIFK